MERPQTAINLRKKKPLNNSEILSKLRVFSGKSRIASSKLKTSGVETRMTTAHSGPSHSPAFRNLSMKEKINRVLQPKASIIKSPTELIHKITRNVSGTILETSKSINDRKFFSNVRPHDRIGQPNPPKRRMEMHNISSLYLRSEGSKTTLLQKQPSIISEQKDSIEIPDTSREPTARLGFYVSQKYRKLTKKLKARRSIIGNPRHMSRIMEAEKTHIKIEKLCKIFFAYLQQEVEKRNILEKIPVGNLTTIVLKENCIILMKFISKLSLLQNIPTKDWVLILNDLRLISKKCKNGYMKISLCLHVVKLYIISQNFDSAIKLIEDLKSLCRHHKVNDKFMKCYRLLSFCYRSQKKYQEALMPLNCYLVLAWFTKDKDKEVKVYKEMSMLYFYLGNLEKAFLLHQIHLDQYTEPEDSEVKNIALLQYQLYDQNPTLTFREIEFDVEDIGKNKYKINNPPIPDHYYKRKVNVEVGVIEGIKQKIRDSRVYREWNPRGRIILTHEKKELSIAKDKVKEVLNKVDQHVKTVLKRIKEKADIYLVLNHHDELED